MKRIRITATAVLIALTGQILLPPSSFASGGNYDEDSSQSTDSMVCYSNPDVFEVLAENPGELSSLLAKYLHAYSSDRIRKLLYASKIKKLVFRNPGSPEYVESLRYIDEISSYSPDAIYDLAKSLQLHWEAQYAVGLGEERDRRVTTGTKIGAIVGMAILGASLLYRPQNAGKYFMLFRRLAPLAPLAGSLAGAGTAWTINSSGMLDGNVPLAPAHVMHLGINTDDYHYNDDSTMRDIVALTASMAAAETAYQVIKAIELVNAAATPAKINPIALVASLVIMFAVEHGVKYAIDEHEYHKFRDKVFDARDAVEAGLQAGDDDEIYTGADALVASSSNLAQYLNRPVLDAIKDYTQKMADYAKKYGEGTDKYQEKLNDATEDFTNTVNDITQNSDYPYDSDYESTLVTGYLLNHDESSIDKLGDNAKARAAEYESGFDNWLAYEQDQQGVDFDQKLREQYFHQYLTELSNAKASQLAGEFLRGDVRRDAKHYLLQAAALLRTTGKEYLEDQVDALMAIIQRHDLLTAVAKDRPLEDDVNLGPMEGP